MRKIFRRQRTRLALHRSAEQHAAQLPHIARPAVPHKDRECVVRNAQRLLARLLGDPGQQVAGKRRNVGAALLSAADAGAVDDPAWGNLETAVNDMLLAGTDRINAIPLPAAMSWVYLVFTLGMVANIALALSTPARLRFGLPVMCLAAFITALLVFLAFELCNPYLVGEYSIPLAHMSTSALGAAP